MELIDIVCANTGRLLGEQVLRHEIFVKELWCRSTNVFVISEAGEVLVHQRSLKKERYPGVWCTHMGGHVGAGETFETNALKELQEESGLMATEKELLPWRTSKIESARLWVREFVTVVNKNEVTLVPQPGEVEQFAWMSIDDLLAAEAKNPDQWLVGTHDFRVEYACLRAVIVAAQTLGTFEVAHGLHTWHPINEPAVATA
jgi:isopentenyldiphosphate isomerase